MTKKIISNARHLILPPILNEFSVSTNENDSSMKIGVEFIKPSRTAVSFVIKKRELRLGHIILNKKGKRVVKEKLGVLQPVREIVDWEKRVLKPANPDMELLLNNVHDNLIPLYPVDNSMVFVKVVSGKVQRYEFTDTGVLPGRIYVYTLTYRRKSKSILVITPSVMHKRKALCIAMSRTSSSWNDSTVDDAEAMKKIFGYNGIPAEIIVDPTLDELKSKISTCFDGFTDKDYPIIWSASHGSLDGLHFLGQNHGFISFADYRDLLDDIPGHKIVFVFACHSGNAIGAYSLQNSDLKIAKRTDVEIAQKSKEISEKIKTAFVPKPRTFKSGELATEDFSVICSCRGSEVTWGNNFINPVTKCWCEGLGILGNREADVNGNNNVTVSELNDYVLAHKDEVDSTSVCYPENDSTVIVKY